MTRYEALIAALDRIGSQAELARICGVSSTAVWKWVKTCKQLPAEFVLRVEEASGISRHALRPDIYPVDLLPSDRFVGVDRRVERHAYNGGAPRRSAAA